MPPPRPRTRSLRPHRPLPPRAVNCPPAKPHRSPRASRGGPERAKRSAASSTCSPWQTMENQMSPKTRRRLEALFDLYSSNASLYSELNGVFVCPLCFRGFERSAIEKKLLSVEHVVSSKLGGRIETLTCTKCNNNQGSSLDAPLINRVRAEDRLAGLEPIPSKLTIGQAEVTTNVILLPGENGSRPWLIG